jgi:hypothetical protein
MKWGGKGVSPAGKTLNPVPAGPAFRFLFAPAGEINSPSLISMYFYKMVSMF